MRILIIEEDRKIREFLEVSLESAGFVVDFASTGEKGSFIARTNDYDAMICEYFLPEKSAVSVCKEIRSAGKKFPILIISESREIEDKIKCFNAGADDYILKPFSLDELLARISVIMRRPRFIEEKILKIESVELETTQQRVMYKDKEVYMTKKEFALLEYMMKNEGRVLSRGMILEHVWDMNTNPFSNTIETHIMSIRRKIKDIKKKLIVSIHGRGYKMGI